MPSPIADGASVCNLILILLISSILTGVLFVPTYIYARDAAADPTVCSACPAKCATAADCPAVLYSSNFNASVSCTKNGCVYEYIPLSPIMLPQGPVGDQFCRQKLLRAPPCFSMYSIGDCTGMVTECYGAFLCQYRA